MGRRFFASNSSRGRRRSLLRNQVADLILSGSLVTTEARAKILKTEVERFISRAKKADLSTRRKVLAFLPKERAAEKFLGQIVPQFSSRVGGFVRVVKLSPRRGDNAPMARVEFVEEIKEVSGEKETKETKMTRKTKAARPRKGEDGKLSGAKSASGGKGDGKKNKSNKSK